MPVSNLTLVEYVLLFLRTIGVDMTPMTGPAGTVEFIEETGAYALTLRGFARNTCTDYDTKVYAYPEKRELFVNAASNQDWWEEYHNVPMNFVEMAFKEHGFIGPDGQSWSVKLI